jgi:peptidoglycan/LPS O-acetylase OafA/YrhL
MKARLYAVFESWAGFPLTRATIAWGALRIVPCFALGCALFLAHRAHATHRRTALAGALFFGAAVIAFAQFRAPDALVVAACGGLIIALAQGSKAGSRLGSHPVLVYLGEISYSVYMVCIPWQLLFANLAVKTLNLTSKQLPWYAWLILFIGPVPLAALAHHLIEQPARAHLKLWRASRPSHRLAITNAG